MKKTNANHFIIIVFLTLLLGLSFSPVRGAAQEKGKEASTKNVEYIDLKISIENALNTEKENIDQLKDQLKSAQSLKKAVTTELNVYKIQLSSYGNLLLIAKTKIETLEKAWADNRASLDNIAANLKETNQKLITVNESRQRTDEQHALNEKQLAEIKTQGAKDPQTTNLLYKLQELTKHLSTKRELLEKLNGIYSERKVQLENTQKALVELSKKFEQQINEKKKQELFERGINPLKALELKQIGKELNRFSEKILSMFSKDFWVNELTAIWNSENFLIVTFFIIFIIFQVLLFRLKNYCSNLERKPFCEQYPWRLRVLQLFHRSLPLMGTILFIYIYARIRLFYSTAPLIQIVIYILLIFLFTRWGFDLLKLWNQEKRYQISEQVLSHLRLLLIIIRIFAIPYVILAWLIGSASIILLILRMVFEIFLLSWNVLFLKHFNNFQDSSIAEKSRKLSILRVLCFGLSYTITGGGLLLELAGYGALALYWFKAWGLSTVVLLLGGLVYFLLMEWDMSIRRISESDNDLSHKASYPFKWLLIRFCWLLWFAGISISLIVIWGPRQALLESFMRVLNYPFHIGEMQLTLMGLISAFLIIFFTHAAIRFWRYLLQKKILAPSGMEPGLRDSITTITVYLLWIIGILAALNAFGLNTTSLAIAFGALGIGLGFGLQNIFNNFISGIILLFERPIQVGDAIEVNGTWATVTKINVRSTVVQTYDNASLIIPNSDLISQQVTNWSFKDLRLRRKITVGVAYGSDIELVRKTLLEIADKTPKVLKYPKPDVIFSDFGDSALIFILRVWTDIDNMFITETDIRFGINRLFNERKIEIAFPQRDLHIRSYPEGIRLEKEL
ncbi:MAG: mechanosensitive ion channel [Desulfobacterales bacterium]|nr:mechanosensitive ion channel [Desulfobacterales bacterium]